MKFPKAKSVLLFCIMLAVFYFTNDFSIIDIEKTAIVVAIGIDEGKDGYEVTAQIAVPQATDNASANDDAVITSSGKTPFEAIENVAAKSGWHAKLSFCGVVILGRAVAEKSATAIIDYLISSEKFENSTLAVVSDTTAKELLFAVTPLDAISSFALQKIVLKNEWHISPVNVTNIKKFAVSHYSRSNAAFLPVVKVIKGDNKGKEGTSSAVTASTGSGGDKKSGGSEGGDGGSGEDKTVIFDVSNAALFKNGQYCATVDGEHARIMTMLLSPVKENYIEVELDGQNYYLHIDCKKKAVNVGFDDLPKIEYKLKLCARLVDSTAENPLDKPDDRSELNDKLLCAVKEKLETTIKELNQTLSESDCDVLGIRDKIYKFHNDKYEAFRNLPLDAFEASVDVRVYSLD